MQIPSLEQSEANGFMLELGEFRNEVSKDKGIGLFERWVTWLSNCDPVKDPHGYGASADTIFDVIELLQGLISVEETKTKASRIFVIIEKNGIEDEYHEDFLERKRKALFLK